MNYEPEKNLEVALVCGFNARIFDFAAEGRRCIYRNDRGGESVFEPWTDLNAASIAAEKFGLFANAAHVLVNPLGAWRVVEYGSIERGDPVTVGCGATEAEAICSAILAIIK